MTDALGWRHCFGVLGPSTNTIVQPDMEAMRPAGVTNHLHAGRERLQRRDVHAGGAADQRELVMGMSAVTFFDGMAINTATYWHALRDVGITDKMAGFGRLLEEF